TAIRLSLPCSAGVRFLPGLKAGASSEEPGDDNTYQLEFRDGVAAEHYQTRTISQEKVLTAMLGWAVGKADWKDGFMWNSIGSQFGADDAQQQG
ncbi:hypothetical protein ABT124_19865, partial [Streptomyces sp. NPDC001982]